VKLGFAQIAYGRNLDDDGDLRPGQRAAAMHRALAPLAEARLGKQEIRRLAREAGLKVADKPASACLSSRIEYGRQVTAENLSQVERAEDAMHALGFLHVRVRHTGSWRGWRCARGPAARVEPCNAGSHHRGAAAAGICLCHAGHRGLPDGSMNDVLPVSAIGPRGRGTGHKSQGHDRVQEREFMRVAYIDCFAGIARRHAAGRAVDAGVPAQVLADATASLNIGASLRIERVDRSGIACTKVHVLVDRPSGGGPRGARAGGRAQPRSGTHARRFARRGQSARCALSTRMRPMGTAARRILTTTNIPTRTGAR